MAGKHISIPALLKIGAGALDNLGIYLKELQLQKVVVLFGNGLVEMFGSTVMEALQQEDIDILEYQELDTVRLEDLTRDIPLENVLHQRDVPQLFQCHRHRWRKSD